MKKGLVITGGANGIGKQIVLDFLNEDYEVCIIDIDQNFKNMDNVHYFVGDVSKQDQLEKFYEFVKLKLQRIDVLINNACYTKGGILSNASYDDFDEVLSVGLKAPYYLSLLFRDDLKKQNGNIINIASTRAYMSEPNSETYASAKGGIVALTHSLAISLGPHICVNAIAPGWINVDSGVETPEDIASIPVGRVGRASDISSMVLHLCSQGFITGEVITIDGGMSKRMIYNDCHNWKFSKE